VTLPSEPPIAVFSGLAAHVGDVSIGGPQLDDVTHLADLVVYRGCVAAVFTKLVFPRKEDGLVVLQSAGPLRVRVGRFPPWQNTVVWVRQDRQLAMLRMSGRRRRALRASVTMSGFGIKEDRASLAHGLIYYER
jgi:hypothetical protein